MNNICSRVDELNAAKRPEAITAQAIEQKIDTEKKYKTSIQTIKQLLTSKATTNSSCQMYFKVKFKQLNKTIEPT